ncbi:MAG: GNAT family N-acetyltransferase [Candidatus Izemoplasmatales bacterium]|nr:GNAT family N-acetyltransferase [bacterium]MDZ4197441.1 GNAT family N-acetyltransferase [Candidatus Izemoplasmatales bacterium]
MTKVLMDVNQDIELKQIAYQEANNITRYLENYRFAMVRSRDQVVVGRLNLRIGTNEEVYLFGHIGYEVYEPFRGNHYALQACEIAFQFAKVVHQMNEWIITCNPDNFASRKTIERLSGRLIEICPVPKDSEMYIKGDREKCIFVINR